MYRFFQDFNPEVQNVGLKAKLTNFLWAFVFFCKHRKPEIVYRLGGGLGDHLLCTILFSNLRNTTQKVWMMSFYPEIFRKNPHLDTVVPDSWRVVKYCNFFKIEIVELSYTHFIDEGDKMQSPAHHIAIEILKRAKLHGEFRLCPLFFDIKPFSYHKPYVCIQSADTNSSTIAQNKQWNSKGFNDIASVVSEKYMVIQVGLPSEEKLSNAIDFTESPSISKTAGILEGAEFFIGQEGFLMHLARAVETRSVIIFGGRVKSWQTGYSCNENLESEVTCSPCWQNNNCDYDRMCISDISVGHVLTAIERIEKRSRSELEEDVVNISSSVKN